MKFSQRFISISLIAALVSLSACDILNTPAPETPVPGLVQTLAVQTLSADSRIAALRLSQTPAPTLTSSPTIETTPTLTGPPTYTAFPTIPTELFIPQSIVTETLQTTITPTYYPTPDYTRKLEDGSPAPCNAAVFIADITIPDETRVLIGEKFTKIWRVQNVGACAWTPEYALVLSWGNPFGVEPPVWLDHVVLPGEMYDVVMSMEAPLIPACWQGNWMFQDPEGLRFGTGYKFVSAIHVVISVYLPRVGFLKDPCKIGKED